MKQKIEFCKAFLICCVVSSAGVSCKARTFHTKSSRSFSKSTLPGSSLYEEPEVDPDLLKDDVAPTENPEADNLANAQISENSKGIVYNSMIKPDGTIAGWDAGTWTNVAPAVILDYENLLKTAKVKTTVPTRFAAASVLEILRRNREEFSLNTEGNVKRTEAPSLGVKSRLTSEYPPEESTAQIYALSDITRPFSGSRCAVKPMFYMNPIKWHYMCATPAIFRACTRLNIENFYIHTHENLKYISESETAKRWKILETAAANDLKFTIEFCLDPKGFESKHPELRGVYYSKGSFPEEFQRFYKTQVVNGVNMFDYIMRSPVYAFDFTQQQAVLNAYYGYMKPKTEGAFDPTNKDDCEKYREPSGEEKTGGNYCLPETPRTGLYYSIGR